jgi:hypothetical protein
MSIQKVSIALASVMVMAAGVPAFANTINTSGVSQTSIQSNIISGNRSSGVNNSTQRATTSQSGRRTDNEAGTIQGNDQLNDVSGNRSNGRNTSIQTSNTTQRR